MRPNSESLPILIISLSICALLATFFFQLSEKELAQYANNVPCSADFMMFYSAATAISGGENPYDPAVLDKIQIELGRSAHIDKSVLIHNAYPPWLYFFLYPISALDFFSAAVLWSCANICFALWASFFTNKLLFGHAASPWHTLAGALLCYPVWETLVYGSVDLLAVIGATSALFAISKKHMALAGVLLVIASIKPQALLFFALYLLVWIIQQRQIKIIGYFVLLTVTITGILEYAVPGMTLGWFENITSHRANFGQPIFASLLKNLISENPETFPIWPSFAVPAIAIFGLLAYVIIGKHKLNLQQSLPLVIFISIWFAPYGWTHDQSFLLIVHTAIVVLATKMSLSATKRGALFCLIFLPQLFAFGFYSYWIHNVGMFVWFAPVEIIIWFGLLRIRALK